MIRIQDLHIEQEILPLIDFTHNDFAKKSLIKLLNEPLCSIEEIVTRQDILKGFIADHIMLKKFSYSRTDLMEVHQFLGNFPFTGTSANRLRLKFFLSENERHQKRAKFIQVVLLFHKFHTYYFGRLNTRNYPEIYQKQLHSIIHFLSSFKLNHFELLIRENRFQVKHIIELSVLITRVNNSGETALFWNQLFLFEAYLSLSFGIIKHSFTFPVFSENIISLTEFYHPVLRKPIKNELTSGSNLNLFTGPNMSGKSTLLKAISLCVYLGHIGMGVPASKAVFPFFDTILIRINHNDDILNGYSHFMTEVIDLKKLVLDAAQERKCFAVFDELFIGTNIEDAIDISSAALNGLAKYRNSLFLISTHLHQLKETAVVRTKQASTWFLDCELDEENPLFTYKLKEGWSEVKVGRLLFNKEGLTDLLR